MALKVFKNDLKSNEGSGRSTCGLLLSRDKLSKPLKVRQKYLKQWENSTTN